MAEHPPLYRVQVKTTGALQPDGSTFWNREIVYCGDDYQEARTAYHQHAPNDFSGGFGNKCTRTVFERLDDAETGTPEDDPATEL